MCGEGFETLRLSISDDETTLVAEVPNYQIFVRLSAVKYPNYMGVLPERKMAGVLGQLARTCKASPSACCWRRTRAALCS